MCKQASDQARIIAFLASPGTHGGLPVARIDTPISHVFLTPDRAYKLKRAIALPFLDFSTPGRRRAACENEIRVNRRYPSRLYRGVVPITETDGALEFGGTGTPVDWVVEMDRFDERHDFAALVGRGEIDGGQIDHLADLIAAQHGEAAPVLDPAAGLSIPETIGKIARQLDGLTESEGLHSALTLWHGEAAALAHRLAGRMETRRAAGAVRPCHGDLHMGNLCMVGGNPMPFDAIEFDDRIATIDVLYDIAFLSMDLLAHGRKDFANRLVNRYLGMTSDYDGLDLMPLFMSLRAAIRAMVCLRMGSGERHRGADYLTLAVDLLNTPRAPVLVAVGGLSGTGKSTLAAALGPKMPGALGAVILRTDVIRKTLAGVAPDHPLPPQSYTKASSDAVYDRLFHLAGRTLGTGQAVILDGVFLDPAERARARAIAIARGVTFRGFWLETDRRDMLETRIENRCGDASDATVAVLEFQAAKDTGPMDWNRVDAAEPLHAMTDACLQTLTTSSAARWPSPFDRRGA